MGKVLATGIGLDKLMEKSKDNPRLRVGEVTIHVVKNENDEYWDLRSSRWYITEGYKGDGIKFHVRKNKMEA